MKAPSSPCTFTTTPPGTEKTGEADTGRPRPVTRCKTSWPAWLSLAPSWAQPWPIFWASRATGGGGQEGQSPLLSRSPQGRSWKPGHACSWPPESPDLFPGQTGGPTTAASSKPLFSPVVGGGSIREQDYVPNRETEEASRGLTAQGGASLPPQPPHPIPQGPGPLIFNCLWYRADTQSKQGWDSRGRDTPVRGRLEGLGVGVRWCWKGLPLAPPPPILEETTSPQFREPRPLPGVMGAGARPQRRGRFGIQTRGRFGRF